MEPVANQNEVKDFQLMTKNPAEVLYLTQSVLIQKNKGEPKVDRQLFMSGVGMYICHKSMITRRFMYRMIKTVVVALMSGECLIMMDEQHQHQADLLIDSFEFREAVVNLIMKFNRAVNVIYKEETTLQKYITVMEKGQLKSTPVQEQSQLAAFKKLLDQYQQEKISTEADVQQKDYALLQVIKQSPSGRLYYALHRPTKQHVVLRVLRKELIGRGIDMQTLKLQRQLLERINSPFICTLKQCFMTQTRLFWAFQYLPSKTLRHLIDRMKTFPDVHVELYIGQIAVALGVLHEFGYSYNNLNSDHVVLDEKGHIKLINLRNCAELEEYSNNAPPLAYLSPERVSNRKENGASAASDWWSLGIILYELMFAGKYPFRGDGPTEISKAIMQSEPDTKGSIVSQKCIDLLRQLLKKDPQNRLGSKNGSHEILAHPFFENCRHTDLRSRTHVTYFCSKGHGKYEFKNELQLSICLDSPQNRLVNESFENFDYSAST